MRESGVSLVELLLVVAIFLVVITSSFSLSTGFMEKNSLNAKTSEMVNSLRVAQINSISGKEDSVWGVRIDATSIVLFKGVSYASRDSFFDETYEIPSRLSLSSVPQEVVFDNLTGNPSSTFTITLNNDSGDSISVSVNEVGVVNVN